MRSDRNFHSGSNSNNYNNNSNYNNIKNVVWYKLILALDAGSNSSGSSRPPLGGHNVPVNPPS